MAKAIVLCDLCKAATVEMHCHLCATNLCDDCITKHTSSDDEKAHELVHHKVLPILQETRELKTSIYPNIKHKIAEIENEIAETEHEIKMKNGDLEALKEHHTEMTTRLSLLYFRITENNKLIRSNNIEDMENYQSIICEYRDPPKKHSLDTVRDLKHLILFPYEKSKIQTLYHSTLPENGVLFNVDARLGPQKVWVSGNDHKIRCYNMQGSIQQTVLTTTRNPPNGIALTLHGEVIFTDQAKKSINIFRYGKTEKIVTLQGWVPNQICCSASGEFLVTMYNPGETSRVVRYLWSTEKQVIQYDEKKKPLFSSEPLFIAENSNTDMICVSDCGTRKVMVLSQAGKLKSIYTGNLSSKKFKSFTPRGLVIDCNGQILVADIKNQCIHIIDNDGFLISYIQCELKNPYDLSFDSHNTLYVAEFTTGEVSAIKYIS